MLSTKRRNSTPLPDPSEFELARLSDDADFQRAQMELAATEQTLLEAEKRHAAVQTPTEDRAAFREVERLRTGLTTASEKLREVADRKSLETCRRFRPQQGHYLRALLDSLEAASDAFGCLAALQARIAAAGYAIRSDVLGVSLPPAVYQLGSPGDFDSPLARFRRWLQAEGVIE
jgi:hypothetical protein